MRPFCRIPAAAATATIAFATLLGGCAVYPAHPAHPASYAGPVYYGAPAYHGPPAVIGAPPPVRYHGWRGRRPGPWHHHGRH